jgi:hypothetical protein
MKHVLEPPGPQRRLMDIHFGSLVKAPRQILISYSSASVRPTLGAVAGNFTRRDGQVAVVTLTRTGDRHHPEPSGGKEAGWAKLGYERGTVPLPIYTSTR